MPSIVDLCNEALDLLGQTTIVAIDPPDTDSKNAALCARTYPLIRDQIQRAFPWKRLITRVQIAADIAAPVWGFDKAFTIPGDLSKLLDVFVGDFRLDLWNLEGDQILCNEDGPVQIRYIKQNDDPNTWDSLMQASVSSRMAYVMAPTLVGHDSPLYQIVKDRFKEIWIAARHANGQEGTPMRVGRPDPWVSVRVGTEGDFLERGIS